MKILITAGCTREPIDGIRNITSIPSIELGVKIAKEAILNNFDVLFVTSEKTNEPTLIESKFFQQYQVDSFQKTYECLKKCFEKNKIDYLIQTMAISDFMVAGYIQKKDIKNNLDKDIESLLIKNNNKITSDDDIFIYLKRVPKIINEIKKWSLKTKIIGFKLLVNASEKERYEALFKQVNNANSDYIVFNDYQNIDEINHIAHLYSKNDLNHYIKKFKNKQEIANGLIELIKGNYE